MYNLHSRNLFIQDVQARLFLELIKFRRAQQMAFDFEELKRSLDFYMLPFRKNKEGFLLQFIKRVIAMNCLCLEMLENGSMQPILTREVRTEIDYLSLRIREEKLVLEFLTLEC